MKRKHLENIKIICTVTNDLYRDRRMIRICQTLSDDYGAEVNLVGFKKEETLELTKYNFNQTLLNVYFKKGFLFYLEYNLRLFFFLLFNKFDIVNSNDTDTVLPGLLVSKLKRKKIVFDAHEYFQGLPELDNSFIKRNVWGVVEKLTLPFIKNNYTVSDSLMKIYKQKYNTVYKVIRNLPLKSRFDNIAIPVRKNMDNIILTYVGVLNKGRGLESCIRMMKYFDGNVKLLLIGGGDLENELKNIVKENKLEDRVTFTGWVSPEKIPYLLKDSHIGLNLLDNNSINYKVSLANKVFDYIHLGIPCLTMNFEEYIEINNKYNCFVLIDNIDPKYVYYKIDKVLNDNEKYELLCSNSLKAAEDLHWEKEKSKLLEIYM